MNKVEKSRKELSKKTLNKSFWLWFYGHQVCYSLELMQTLGYMTAMYPIIDELYETDEEKRDALNTYSAFFNTEPQLGTVVVGITVGLEEARANNENVDGDMIAGIKSGLMGPIAAIGDSLIVATLIPLLLGIGVGLSTDGSPLGAIFYIVTWLSIAIFGMKYLYHKGYELGARVVEFIVGEESGAIRDSIVMLGTIVIGAVSASWINVSTALTMTDKTGNVIIDLNEILQGIFPGLLTVLTIMFSWYLLSKKKMSTTKVMLILLVISIVGVLVGFFDPSLTY